MTCQQSSDAESYIITEVELKKLYWNYGSASPAASELLPTIHSRPYDPAALKSEERERIFAILKILCSCDDIGIGTRIYDSMRIRFPEG